MPKAERIFLYAVLKEILLYIPTPIDSVFYRIRSCSAARGTGATTPFKHFSPTHYYYVFANIL